MKSQAELIGITIVMVLVMLGIVFVIKFVIIPEDVNIKKVYDKAQIGANFIDAMLITKTGCNELSMRDLIVDCFDSNGNPSAQRMCPEDTQICLTPGGCRSCQYLNSTLEVMLNETLNAINTQYDLFICKWSDIMLECESEVISNFSHRSCLASNKEYDAKQTLVRTSRNVRVIQIYVC